MTLDAHDDDGSPIPERLRALARAHTSAEATNAKHLATRHRVLETMRERPRERGWRVALPALVAVLVVVGIGALLARRSSRSEVAITMEPVSSPPNASAGGGGDRKARPPVPHADAVIDRLRPRFRACYEGGLSSHPKASGRVILETFIAPAGEVTSATILRNDGLPADMAECLVAVVRTAKFEGNGRASRLEIPVEFVQSP